MGPLKGSFRELTDWEKRLLQHLLSTPFPGRDALLEQFGHLKATEMDEDGTALDSCGSLNFCTTSSVRAYVSSTVPVEGMAPDADGVMIHYLLFVDRDGRMDQLDIHKEDGSQVIQHPDPAQIDVT